MVAENLGSIPPNTAMLVVTAGEKRYQLFLSSTTEKSARVRFVYNKNDVDTNKKIE
jgi:type IV secretory pathway VirB9-like protein